MSYSYEPTTHAETIAEQNEKRWDRGAWLTLAMGLTLVLLPLVLALAGMRYPSDGWDSSAVAAFGVTGPYRLIGGLTEAPSLLQPEDHVIAINGRPLTDDILPPVPPDTEAGQFLRYTVERSERTLELQVPVVRLTPADIPRSWIANFQDNPGNALFGLLMTSVAVGVFILRPGNLAARYLFLFAMFGQGINITMYNGIFLGTNPPWMAFLGQLYGWGWTYLFMPIVVLIVLVFPVRKWPVRRFPHLTPFMLIGLPLLVGQHRRQRRCLVWRFRPGGATPVTPDNLRRWADANHRPDHPGPQPSDHPGATGAGANALDRPWFWGGSGAADNPFDDQFRGIRRRRCGVAPR